MIKWFLTNNNAWITLLCLSPITFVSLEMYLKHFNKFNKNKIKVIIYYVFSFTPLIVITLISINIKTIYISNDDWTTIYQNNIDADIILNINNDKLKTSKIKAGENIDDYKTYISNEHDGTVTAQKNKNQWSQSIVLTPNNIIKKERGTKLIKVEYRKLQSQQKKLLNYIGNIEQVKYDGEIRITIGDDQNQNDIEELKKLFKWTKQ